jgi:hypothetical protein
MRKKEKALRHGRWHGLPARRRSSGLVGAPERAGLSAAARKISAVAGRASGRKLSTRKAQLHETRSVSMKASP